MNMSSQEPAENQQFAIQPLFTPTDRINAIGNLPDAVGYLHNDGTGIFIYSDPTVYPGVGIGVSTGSAWTTSLSSTDPYFTGSVKTPIIYPNADSTTAVQIMKADKTTPVMIVDTTNARVKIGGTVSPTSGLEIAGLAQNTVEAISSYSATASQQAGIQLRKSHSNTETIVATVDTETLGYIGWLGVNAAGPAFALSASIEVVQNGTQGGSDTFPAADIIFKTSPGGTTARVERARIKKDGTNTFGISTQTDATASRAINGTVYQNTGTKPIYVSVVATQSVGLLSMAGFTDVNAAPVLQVTAFTFMSGTTTINFVVLPNNYYKVTSTNAVIAKWIEWN
jgi:hypothetical protein